MTEVRFNTIAEAIDATKIGGVIEERVQFRVALSPAYQSRCWDKVLSDGYYVKEDDLV